MNDPVFPGWIAKRDSGDGYRGGEGRKDADAEFRSDLLDKACRFQFRNGDDSGETPCLDDVLRAVEREIIRSVLVRTGGNQSRAGRILAVKPSTLSWKIRKLGLDSEFGRYARPEWKVEADFPKNQSPNR